MKTALILFISLMFTGCFALHDGMLTGTASLTSANFQIVNSGIAGKANTVIFCGFGGGFRNAIVAAAKKDLLEKHPLQKNQALANVTVDFKTTFFLGVVVIRECYIFADIVEFTK
jgi:hypothetical protein